MWNYYIISLIEVKEQSKLVNVGKYQNSGCLLVERLLTRKAHRELSRKVRKFCNLVCLMVLQVYLNYPGVIKSSSSWTLKISALWQTLKYPNFTSFKIKDSIWTPQFKKLVTANKTSLRSDRFGFRSHCQCFLHCETLRKLLILSEPPFPHV